MIIGKRNNSQQCSLFTLLKRIQQNLLIALISIILLTGAGCSSSDNDNLPDADTDQDVFEQADTLDGDTPDGDMPDGDTSDGDTSDGDTPDGDTSDGDTSDGDTPDGDTPDGDAPDGDTPDGDTPDGDTPDGDLPDGDTPDGDTPDGDLPDGDMTDGDTPDGDTPDGDLPDGDTPDGDTPDGDTPDGDLPDGDTPDGDTPDGDMSDGDTPDGDMPDGDIDVEIEIEIEFDLDKETEPEIVTYACEGMCGNSNVDGCNCDELCFQYDDCCPDICLACPEMQGCQLPDGDVTSGTGLSCDDPLLLDIEGDEVTNYTNSGSSAYSGECAGDGKELIYTFNLPGPHKGYFYMSGYDTVLHMRTQCDDPETEIACNDDTISQSAVISMVLQRGTYYLFADSYDQPGGFQIDYTLTPDPCEDEETACPGDPVCQPNEDWSAFDCVCPDGTILFEESCVTDLCSDNPCTTPNQTRCVMDLPDSYHCDCNPGYIGDGQGACVPDPQAKEWTFMVFMNADNNLEPDGYEDLQEMGQAGSTEDVNIVALFDTLSNPAKRVYVTQGGYDVLETVGEVDMSDWRVLAEFGEWAVQAYPARHYALILWDHGDGWTKAAPGESPLFKGFSNDDHGTAGEISISNGDYARALARIHSTVGAKLDLVGFDACLMGMWEVAEASAPYSHLLLASQETEPLAGWPYQRFLPALIADPSMSAEQLGTNVVNAYYNYDYEDSTLSLSDLDSLDNLDRRLSTFANVMLAHPEMHSTFEQIRRNTQDFDYTDEFRDLRDFARRVMNLNSAPVDVGRSAASLLAQLDETILHSRAQDSHPRAYGLSIYFPERDYGMDSRYRGDGAIWSVRTTWDEFIEEFTR